LGIHAWLLGGGYGLWLWVLSFCLRTTWPITAHGCGLSSLALDISFSISLSLVGHRETTSGVGACRFCPNKGGGPSVFLEARHWLA
jgi:hypothetical protein